MMIFRLEEPTGGGGFALAMIPLIIIGDTSKIEDPAVTVIRIW